MIGYSVFPGVVIHQHANTLGTGRSFRRELAIELSWTYYGFADDAELMHRRRLLHANLFGPAGYVAVDDGEVLAQLGGPRSAPDRRRCWRWAAGTSRRRTRW